MTLATAPCPGENFFFHSQSIYTVSKFCQTNCHNFLPFPASPNSSPCIFSLLSATSLASHVAYCFPLCSHNNTLKDRSDYAIFLIKSAVFFSFCLIFHVVSWKPSKSPFWSPLWQPFFHGHTSATSTFPEFSLYFSVKHMCASLYLHTAFVLFEVFCLYMPRQLKFSRSFCHFRHHWSEAFPDLHAMESLSWLCISKPGRLLYFSSQQLYPLSILGDICLTCVSLIWNRNFTIPQEQEFCQIHSLTKP